MDFARKRIIWFILSLIVIIPGVISLGMNGLNFGIDFAGGNLVQVKFDEAVTVDQIKESLTEIDYKDALVQESDNGIFIIKTKVIEQAEQDSLVKHLNDNLSKLEILKSEKVGPSIGKELRKAGILSLVIALVLMVIYITIRFEFLFGIAAIVALVHDVLVIVGIFSILQIEVNTEFIAAILTIIGYSINDTIVIFDRIRENMRKTKTGAIEDIVNTSIRQTLTRSINTSLTVLFIIVSLYVLGGESTKTLNFALLIGVISGAYSSIFTASPVWVALKNSKAKKA